MLKSQLMEKMQTIIFMVRHGQTSEGYSFDPKTDSQRQLSNHGRIQAKKVGTFLEQFQPSAIYSSPLDRCFDTATIIKSVIKTNSEIITTNALLEYYPSEQRQDVGERVEPLFETILKEYRGEQVVAVTHQYIVTYEVAKLWEINYRQVPCDFADIYRLVFAGSNLVEATLLQPAK